MRVPTTLLSAFRETTTWTVPWMPCCCAIGGVSGSTGRMVVAATFGRAQLCGVGVGFGVGGGGVAGAGVAAGAAGAGAEVPWPCGMPCVLPCVCVFAFSVGPVLLLDSVLSVLILILGCCGAGVCCGGGVCFGGGVGGSVGCGVGVGGGVGGGVGTRTTVTFCGVSSDVCVFLNLRNGPPIRCSAIEIAKPYSRKFFARSAAGAGGRGSLLVAI